MKRLCAICRGLGFAALREEVESFRCEVCDQNPTEVAR